MIALACAAWSSPALAHPHVFVDGGVDIVFDEAGQITALEITWVFDPLDSLYQVAAHGVSPLPDGTLSDEDTARMTEALQMFPDDFDGSAHVSVVGVPVALSWPEDVEVSMVDGRLRQAFRRALETPLDVTDLPVEIGFYERTYFFDFSITQQPELRSAPSGCNAAVVPFVPETASQAVLDMLARLASDTAPEDANAGALVADRIVMTCVP
ncbi:hypothetical protein JANAI62_24880 [Jannaschia pagri]|uniref:Polyphosphate kinase n=1 Tax=Jannaschia pagri TaxID=2829797 RepID=A0ABQ4NNM6_9RHOB|nr:MULTISPECIES: DUF1007 family protein [unclassified Jannaschia]GIT92031.1 hypothetical protein JANAI61_24890 [Jannaschia sp. AI_61]GIT95865.1 hypothetical protein JANAI62_24880 [Jannaschia sp. AI_62]